MSFKNTGCNIIQNGEVWATAATFHDAEVISEALNLQREAIANNRAFVGTVLLEYIMYDGVKLVADELGFDFEIEED